MTNAENEQQIKRTGTKQNPLINHLKKFFGPRAVDACDVSIQNLELKKGVPKEQKTKAQG